MRFERSLLLDIGARTVVPTLALVSIYVLVVGHDEPGGGFIGGLLGGVALLVVHLSAGASQVANLLRADPLTIVGAGLSVAVATALAGLIFGAGLLDAGKITVHLPWLGSYSVGSALAFDAGVYLVVVGLVAMALTRLGADEEGAA
jgi:multicomponent Na+:H+ antiporter subunit A